MIYFKIPHKNDVLLQTISFDYNLVNGFFVCTQPAKRILDMQKNTVYLLERFSASASIPEPAYTSGLIIDNLIKFNISREKSVQTLNEIPVLTFYRDKNLSAFFTSDSYEDKLLLKAFGQIKQTQELIGIDKITISLLFDFYAISNNSYNKNFREELTSDYGSDIRK